MSETLRTKDLVLRLDENSQKMSPSGSEIHDLMDIILRFKLCKLQGAKEANCFLCPLNKNLIRAGYADMTEASAYIEMSLCRTLREIEDRIHAGYFKQPNTQRRLHL